MLTLYIAQLISYFVLNPALLPDEKDGVGKKVNLSQRQHQIWQYYWPAIQKNLVHSCTVFGFCYGECRKIPMTASVEMGDLGHAFDLLGNFLRSDNIIGQQFQKTRGSITQFHSCMLSMSAMRCAGNFWWPRLCRWVTYGRPLIYWTDLHDQTILLACNSQKLGA